MNLLLIVVMMQFIGSFDLSVNDLNLATMLMMQYFDPFKFD